MDVAGERRALQVFEAYLDAAPADAASWIIDHCDGDAALEGAVRALVSAEEHAAGVLPTVAPGTMAARFDVAAPERVGAYRLTERIGRGGMGDVWRAERDDGLFEQAVAVKLLRPSLFAASSEAFFDTERRVLARLKHKNIAQLFDGGVDPSGVSYFVMELLSGLPIDAHVAQRRCGAREIVRLVVDVCAGVQNAHASLVVHADIKPSNIVVDTDGTPKLLDFGIAQVLQGPREQHGEHGAFPLTPAYASPQRLAGDRPTPSDDVFALGVMLRELVTGNPREEDETLPLRIGGHAGASASPPADADLATIIAKATEPRAEQRYESVSALSGDLQNWLAVRPLAGRADDWRYSSSLFVRRHRRAVAAAVVAVVGLIGALVVTSALYERAERARAQAEQRFNEVRALARFQIFDLYDALAQTPGTTETRYRMTQQAQVYLDRLSRLPGASNLVARETAAAYIRLAEVQGVPGAPNLGALEAARANLLRALAMLERSPTPDTAIDRVNARVMLAGITLWGDQKADAAQMLLSEAEPLLAAGPQTPAWFVARQVLRQRQMEVADWNEDYTRLVEIGAQALQELDTLPDAVKTDGAFAVARARILFKLGDALWYKDDDRAGALQRYRQADAVLDAAAARAPNRTDIMSAQILSGYNIATALDGLDRPATVMARLRQSIAIGERLLQIEARDDNLHRLVSQVRGALTQVLAAQGRFEEAIAQQTALVNANRALRLSHPGEARAARNEAFSVMVLGSINWRANRTRVACARWAEAQGAFLALQAGGSLTTFDVNTHLPFLSNNLAVCAGRKPRTAIQLE